VPSEPPGVVSLQEWLQESVRMNLQSLMMVGASFVTLCDEAIDLRSVRLCSLLGHSQNYECSGAKKAEVWGRNLNQITF